MELLKEQEIKTPVRTLLTALEMRTKSSSKTSFATSVALQPLPSQAQQSQRKYLLPWASGNSLSRSSYGKQPPRNVRGQPPLPRRKHRKSHVLSRNLPRQPTEYMK